VLLPPRAVLPSQTATGELSAFPRRSRQVAPPFPNATDCQFEIHVARRTMLSVAGAAAVVSAAGAVAAGIGVMKCGWRC
jgi:hypothetical protein